MTMDELEAAMARGQEVCIQTHVCTFQEGIVIEVKREHNSVSVKITDGMDKGDIYRVSPGAVSI